AARGQLAADVDELPEAPPGEEADGAADEGVVLPRGHPRLGDDLDQPFGHLAVGRVVVLAAEQIVVDPRRVGRRQIHVGGRPPLISHRNSTRPRAMMISRTGPRRVRAPHRRTPRGDQSGSIGTESPWSRPRSPARVIADDRPRARSPSPAAPASPPAPPAPPSGSASWTARSSRRSPSETPISVRPRSAIAGAAAARSALAVSRIRAV